MELQSAFGFVELQCKYLLKCAWSFQKHPPLFLHFM
jgi:hypothetical protein